MLKRILTAVLITAVSACSAGPATQSIPRLATPAFSKSPASIPVAPMVKTAIQPASEMTSVTPANTITALGWSQILGSATSVAAATDGTVWVLSDQPSGPDKYIYHYSAGTWTNIGGLASQLAVAPNGTVYAINSSGGAYAYSGGNWTALGGGASAVAAASDNSVYVVSNAGSGDQAIWHNVGGAWSQVAGSGVSIAGSFDTASHVLASGTISPGGLYVLNAAGSIYYLNTNNTYVQIPGTASQVAPANGGLFALGTGGVLYYYDLDGQSWSAPGGSGAAIADAAGTLYVIAANGGIYTTAAPTTNWPCNNTQFNSDQAAYANGTLKVSYIEENVCGVVTSVLAAKKTSSGNHGYYYIQLPSGYQIEIVSNLDAMATGSNPPPTTWPWVKTGDYSYAQGRYYYDSASSQGMDWTEDDTGSWPTVGFVVINGVKYN